MELLAILCFVAVGIFYKITTSNERHRWWWNVVAAIIIFGALGAIYTTIKTGSIPAPCCEYP